MCSGGCIKAMVGTAAWIEPSFWGPGEDPFVRFLLREYPGQHHGTGNPTLTDEAKAI
jgi:hypothetical protein